jgi:hypothetical protein
MNLAHEQHTYERKSEFIRAYIKGIRTRNLVRNDFSYRRITGNKKAQIDGRFAL